MSSIGATPRTLLLVEDEPLIRMMVAEYLRDCGYRVREAVDAAEALELVASGGIDLVFTDVDMPGPTDGFGLARRLRSHYPGLPVLITSGLPRMAEIAGELCADGPLLVKPYDCAALAARIGRLLALSRQRGDRGEGFG